MLSRRAATIVPRSPCDARTKRAPLAAGEVRAVTGFSAPESEIASAFAQRAAEQDAEHRLAVELANRIVQRLALSAGTWA